MFTILCTYLAGFVFASLYYLFDWWAMKDPDTETEA